MRMDCPYRAETVKHLDDMIGLLGMHALSKGVMARDGKGAPVHPRSPTAAAFSLSGAEVVTRARTTHSRAVQFCHDMILSAIRAEPGFETCDVLKVFNDHPTTDHAAVLRVLVRAINYFA